MAEHPGPWRTGRHPVDQPGPRGRTLYDADGEFVGLMDSNALADRVVAAVNGEYEAILAKEKATLADSEYVLISAELAAQREALVPLAHCTAPNPVGDWLADGPGCGACVGCRVRAALVRPAREVGGG